MTCKDCIHDGVCHLQEMSTDLEMKEYIKEFGCEDFKNKADFVKAVRCKECKHRKNGIQGYYCDLTDFLIKDDDFCSYGERRDGKDINVHTK